MEHLLRDLYIDVEIDSEFGMELMESAEYDGYSHWIEKINLDELDEEELNDCIDWRINSIDDAIFKKIFKSSKVAFKKKMEDWIYSFNTIESYENSARILGGAYREENDSFMKKIGASHASKLRNFIKNLNKLMENTNVFLCAVISIEKYLADLLERDIKLCKALHSYYTKLPSRTECFQEDLIDSLAVDSTTSMLDLVGICGLTAVGYEHWTKNDSNDKLKKELLELENCKSHDEFNLEFPKLFSQFLQIGYELK
jgi:hypothetical protein